MEGAVDNLTLLLTGKLMEINCIARNTDGKVGVGFGVFVCLHKGFAVKHVYVDVVCLLLEISV